MSWRTELKEAKARRRQKEADKRAFVEAQAKQERKNKMKTQCLAGYDGYWFYRCADCKVSSDTPPSDIRTNWARVRCLHRRYLRTGDPSVLED